MIEWKEGFNSLHIFWSPPSPSHPPMKFRQIKKRQSTAQSPYISANITPPIMWMSSCIHDHSQNEISRTPRQQKQIPCCDRQCRFHSLRCSPLYRVLHPLPIFTPPPITLSIFQVNSIIIIIITIIIIIIIIIWIIIIWIIWIIIWIIIIIIIIVIHLKTTNAITLIITANNNNK